MFSNFSDLIDQAFIKQTAEKNALFSILRNYYSDCGSKFDDSDFLSFCNSLIQNPNISVESFCWFLDFVC